MKNYIIAIGLICAIALGVGYLVSTNQAVGSIIQGYEYNATSTKSYAGTSLTNLTVLKTTGGSLGSVIITGATAVGTINLYDATTTNASLRTKSATTTLITIPSTTLAATYTYDITFNDGLIVELLGTVGTSTITWR